MMMVMIFEQHTPSHTCTLGPC